MEKNHNWIWFFAALVVLGLAAVAINWAYNARRQLTMEQLIAAEDLWDKHGPTDYDLVVEKTIQSASASEPMRDRIEVKVRKRNVVDATINGGPIPHRVWNENDLPAWFGFVERFMQIDSAPGAPRTFHAAEFDPKTGQLLQFIRSVSLTRERQELILRLTPVTD